MLVRLRREYAQLVTSGAQLLLLFVGIKLESREGWLGTLSAMALVSFFAWLSALHRLRTIRDTPTSKIASAAQGYVELIGRGRPFGDTPLISKLGYPPVAPLQDRTPHLGRQVGGRGERRKLDSFVLHDDSGDCVIDPEHAEIVTKHRDQWSEGDYRNTEWKFIQNDNLYVIGEFRTRSMGIEFDARAELNALLAEWKRDRPALHARFDLDDNGELDMKEWALARQAAKREIGKKRNEALTQPDIHLICRPYDGKLFLISNLTPEKLSRRYLFWSWMHLAIFFAALTGIGWLLQSPFF
jgi:hypothetical protein